MCFLVWLFMRSKTGMAMTAAGANPMFAKAAGINVNKMRLIGTTISTVLAAVGILVYAQGFGFMQLYNGLYLCSGSADWRCNTEEGIDCSCTDWYIPVPGYHDAGTSGCKPDYSGRKPVRGYAYDYFQRYYYLRSDSGKGR